MALLINILLGFYIVIAVLMILVILMQRPKSEGLGAAFGGGVTENIFGAQTTNVLTKFTSWLAAIFFLLTFGLSVLYAHKGNPSSSALRELVKDLPTPTATPSGEATPGPTAADAVSMSPTPGASQSPVESTPEATEAPAASSLRLAPDVTPADRTLSLAATATPETTTSSAPSPESSVSTASSPAPTNPPPTHRRRRR